MSVTTTMAAPTTTPIRTGDEGVLAVTDGGLEAMRAILTEAREWGMLGLDLEWTRDGRITWIGLGTANRAVSFWRLGLSEEAFTLVREAMADATLPKLIHNLQADKEVWEREIGPMLGTLDDTMLLHHAAFPGIAHDLQQVVSQFLVVPPWKAWRREEVKRDLEEARERAKAEKKAARAAGHEERNRQKAEERAAKQAKKQADHDAKVAAQQAEKAAKAAEKQAAHAAKLEAQRIERERKDAEKAAAHEARNAAAAAAKEARKAAKAAKRAKVQLPLPLSTESVSVTPASPPADEAWIAHPTIAQPPTTVTISSSLPTGKRAPWKAVKMADDTPCEKCGDRTRALYNVGERWLCDACCG